MPRETDKQRWQRNWADLLQELRVAQTGVQILFAFLLTLPFSSGFPKSSPFQRYVYLVALLAAAGATSLIISPVAVHRALFRRGRKPEVVWFAHRMASAGLAFMLVAMVSSVLLITDFVLPRPVAFGLSGLTGLWFLTFWVGLPLFRREHWVDEDEDRRGEPTRTVTARMTTAAEVKSRAGNSETDI